LNFESTEVQIPLYYVTDMFSIEAERVLSRVARFVACMRLRSG